MTEKEIKKEGIWLLICTAVILGFISLMSWVMG